MPLNKDKKRVIAAFDFDGTLTIRESSLVFMIFCCGLTQTCFALIKSIRTFLMTLIGLASRQDSKEAMLSCLFKGKLKKQVMEKGIVFSSGNLNKILRPDMMERLRWHQKEGHICVLVSANLDVYLEPWGCFEGFQAVLCSKLSVDKNGILTGKLEGLNCWGPEKKRRFFAWAENLPRDSYTLYVYGNSRGDHELLASADIPKKI